MNLIPICALYTVFPEFPAISGVLFLGFCAITGPFFVDLAAILQPSSTFLVIPSEFSYYRSQREGQKAAHFARETVRERRQAR